MGAIAIILLIILGIILLLVEFLLIPGVSIAGIGCLVAMVAAVILAFNSYGTLIGIIVLAAILILVPTLIYYLFKGKTISKMSLNSNIDSKVKNIGDDELKVGDIGVSIGRLAPLGKAKFNGISYEARSLGMYVDPKTKVKLIKIEGNTIIVEPINQ